MTPVELALYPFLLLAGLGVGLLLGRRTNPLQRHMLELESEIEGWQKENDRVAAELQASRDGLQRTQSELGGYQEQVAEHFSGTAERLRDLTLQYRAVYEHLAGGARDLCSDRFLELEEGAFSPGALPPAAAEAPEEADGESAGPESEVETRSDSPSQGGAA